MECTRAPPSRRGARTAATSPKAKPGALLFERQDASRWCPEAKLLAVARPGYAAWAAPAHGGILRVAARVLDVTPEAGLPLMNVILQQSPPNPEIGSPSV